MSHNKQYHRHDLNTLRQDETYEKIGLTLLTCHTSCTSQQKVQESFAPIQVETPTRPAGQEDVIQHNVMTPHPYSRMYQIVGADGYASKYPIQDVILNILCLPLLA